MDTEKKLNFIINILPLVPYVAQGIAAATETFNKLVTALKDGTLDENEMKAMIAERDAVIERILQKTASE